MKPGFRRRILINPMPGASVAALEDDIHCMAVTLRHDGQNVTAVEAEVDRAPWDTCPGAKAVLVSSFTGLPLIPGGTPGNKRQNCTHLYDLADWAMSHALGQEALTYDIWVSDPEDGGVVSELWRNGVPMLRWTHRDNVLTSPAELAGASLIAMRDRLSPLPPAEREAAKILQWASLVAHGRTMPWFKQADATAMPPNCYNFQPGRAALATRKGEPQDFSANSREPLSGFDGQAFVR